MISLKGSVTEPRRTFVTDLCRPATRPAGALPNSRYTPSFHASHEDAPHYNPRRISGPLMISNECLQSRLSRACFRLRTNLQSTGREGPQERTPLLLCFVTHRSSLDRPVFRQQTKPRACFGGRARNKQRWRGRAGTNEFVQAAGRPCRCAICTWLQSSGAGDKTSSR